MKTNGRHMKRIFLAVSISMFIMTTPLVSGEYEDFLKNEKKSFQSYKDARDSEFIGFLKEQWLEFKAHKGLTRDEKPKPVKLPVAEPVAVKPILPGKSKIIEKIIIPDYKPVKKPVVKPEPPIEPEAIKINFYMVPIVINGEYKFPEAAVGKIDKKMITDFWDQMSNIDYDSFIKQVQMYRKKLGLNDWGYHNILYRLSLKHYSGNKNMANLFIWYMSSKSGYESRIGYNENRIFLLMPSRNRLYSVPFLTLKGKKYYSLSFDSTPEKFKSLYTYKGAYPKANKLMDFRILNSPEIGKALRKKSLRFKYEQKNYLVPAKYNKNLVDYYKYYPQTNIKVYFDAFVSPETEFSLLKSLKPKLQGKTESEAVNILLRFVQKSFSYKTDDVQFGREKYMMPEETLYYPFSDCEDRSFIFAFLVKKLLGLDVVGLDYPGHISTAVKFSDNFPGDYVVRNNKKYMVCDPTYINARIGMAMPKYKKVKPKIVKIGYL